MKRCNETASGSGGDESRGATCIGRGSIADRRRLRSARAGGGSDRLLARCIRGALGISPGNTGEERRCRRGDRRPDAPVEHRPGAAVFLPQPEAGDRPDCLQRGSQHRGGDAVLRPGDARDRQDRRRGQARRRFVRDRQPGSGAGADRPDRGPSGAAESEVAAWPRQARARPAKQPARRQGDLAARGRSGQCRTCCRGVGCRDRAGRAQRRAQSAARDHRARRGRSGAPGA